MARRYEEAHCPLTIRSPFPVIQADVREVRWTTFSITAAVLATIYLSVVMLGWRG